VLSQHLTQTKLAVCHRGIVVCHMNKVTLLSQVSRGMVDHLQVSIPLIGSVKDGKVTSTGVTGRVIKTVH